MKFVEVKLTRHIPTFTLLAAITVFAAVANAAAADSRKGNLAVETQSVVQGTTLPVGNYEVREVSTAQGPKVEFVRKYWNEAASEMVQAEEDQLVSQVPVIEQSLAGPAQHTLLEFDPGSTRVTGLEIRGAPVRYVFSGQNVNNTVASNNCYNRSGATN